MAKSKKVNKNGLTIGASVSIDAEDISESNFYSKIEWTLEDDKSPSYEQAEIIIANALYLALKTASENYVASAGDGSVENGRFILKVLALIMDTASEDDFKKDLEKQ